MVVKRLFAFLLFALFSMTITCCNNTAEQTGSDVLLEDILSKQIQEAYKDTAVIIDTVVDIYIEPNLNSERVTQGLFNQPVVVLEEKETWSRVNSVDGSTGWLKSKFIDRNCKSIIKEIYKQRAVVTGRTKAIHPRPDGSITLKEVVMGTELFIKDIKDSYFEVALPGDMTGYITTKDTIKLSAMSPIPETSVKDFIATAQKFKGTQYLTGGISTLGGVDSSGLIYICSRINGIDLPRGPLGQFEFIKNITLGIEDLKPGDLMFFSMNEDLEDVSQVGIFIGDDMILYGDSTKGSVRISELNNEYYQKRYRGIRRIFD